MGKEASHFAYDHISAPFISQWRREKLRQQLLHIDTLCQNLVHCRTHWEELLQSVSNFIFRLIISKHCGRTPRGVKGDQRSDFLWGILNYSSPGQQSTRHRVKSKTIIEKLIFFLCLYLFYSIFASWSTWKWVFLKFPQNFWSFDTPDIPGCASAVIWYRFEPFLQQCVPELLGYLVKLYFQGQASGTG